MNRDSLMKMKSILIDHQTQLLENTKLKANTLNVEKDELKDETDLALNELSQEMKARLGNREALYLKKISSAFQRIQEGTYGVCLDCGDEISLRRLEARPTAELCIHCKEDAEKKESGSSIGRKPKSVGQTIYEI